MQKSPVAAASILLVLSFHLATAAISFSEQPSDAVVTLGSTAIFRCRLDGTSSSPGWRINGVEHSPIFLPRRHSYSSSQGLTVVNVMNVMENDNGNTYQCFLRFINGTVLESLVGQIIITTAVTTTEPSPTTAGESEITGTSEVSSELMLQSTSPTAAVSISSESTEPSPTTAEESKISEVSSPTTAMSISSESYSKVVQQATTANATEVEMESSAASKLLYIAVGAAAGAAAGAIFVLILLMLSGFMIYKSHHRRTVKREAEQEKSQPIYEDVDGVQMKLKMEQNQCYGNTSANKAMISTEQDQYTLIQLEKISTEQNLCYGDLLKLDMSPTYETIQN